MRRSHKAPTDLNDHSTESVPNRSRSLPSFTPSPRQFRRVRHSIARHSLASPFEMASNPGTTTRAPPMFVSQKAKAAPASVDTEQVELRDMIASAPPPQLALKDDIMKLSMHGDDIGLKALLDTGNVSANFQDEEGLTPLHVGPEFFRGKEEL